MEYYDLDQTRLRFFGGTTNIWGGRCALLDPIDFERRSWVPHSGWPIGRAELDPYYRAAHAALELGEFNYEQDIWRTLGVSAPPFDPARLSSKLWRFDTMNERFAASNCADLIAAGNVRILLHANVVHIEANPNGASIDHLRVRVIGGATHEVRARHFVLACGAIENARLLLVSNEVDSRGIGNRHDQVGRFFMEHPHGRIGRIESPHAFELWAALQKRFPRHGPPLAPVLLMNESVQRERGALNSAVTFKLQRDPRRGVSIDKAVYLHLKHALNPTRRGRAAHHAYRAVRAWIQREMRETVERWRARMDITGLHVIVRAEQAPNPHSRVLLSSECDALGVPRADLDWRLSAQDKHTVTMFAATLDEELRRLGIGELRASDWLRDPDPRWPVDPTVSNHPIGGYHHMGTTRMSTLPAQGVVDADCRVHEYTNLYIAGSSVFTTSGWANPTLTILALALRLAEHLDAQRR
jgi:choline dehydrogenase-like flavoprotein